MTAQIAASPSKDVPWFKSDILQVDPAFAEILENYSKIATLSLNLHILDIVRTSLPISRQSPKLNG